MDTIDYIAISALVVSLISAGISIRSWRFNVKVKSLELRALLLASLHNERRTRQYHRLPIEKTRIVTPANMIKAYGAMFLEQAHRTTKDYASLKAAIGKDIFVKGQRMEPYYTAAYALYKLEYFFRNGKIDPKYKAARFHILLAARYLLKPEMPPRANSHDMEDYCKDISDVLWNPTASDALISRASAVIEGVAGETFDRGFFRTEPFTKGVIAAAKAAGEQVAEFSLE